MDSKMKKIVKIIVISLIVITIILSSTVYAGFADFDDETADKQAIEDLKEQEKKDKEAVGKSSNNYLKDLSVNGYKLTPKFDKQIINYKIKEEITDNEIEIEAIPADKRAKIIGIGKVKLQSGENEVKIEVEAENGVKRTYFIKANKKVENIRLNEINLISVNKEGKEESIDISPDFDKDIFEYNCEVNSNISKIDVKIKDSNYSIEIKGNENLKAGKNVITIVAKSKDGDEVIYKINVNKKEDKETLNKVKNNEKKDNKTIISIILIIVLIVIIFILASKNKKSKH